MTEWIEGETVRNKLSSGNIGKISHQIGMALAEWEYASPEKSLTGNWYTYLQKIMNTEQLKPVERAKDLLLSIPLCGQSLAQNDCSLSNLIIGKDNKIWRCDYERSSFRPRGWDYLACFLGPVEINNFGKSSGTEPGSGVGGDDRFIIDLETFNDDFDIIVNSLHAEDVFEISGWDTRTITGSGSSETYTFTYTGTDGSSHTVTIKTYSSFTGENVQIVCFARGTMISTDNGDVPIEDLSFGDEVICGDGEIRDIRWIGSRVVTSSELALNVDLLPIVVKSNAIEQGMPATDLIVSAQHRFKLSNAKAELLFGEPEYLVKAKHLINDTNILRQTDCTEVEYFHFMVDKHSTVFANGVEAETLHPHDQMNSAMSANARSEICKVFPELATDFKAYGKIVAPELSSYEARVLLS